MSVEENSPIRVLVTDDHLIVREGLRLILETEEHIEFVGEAADGEEALRLAEQLSPDVVLMDLRMPGMDGLTAIGHFSHDFPDIAVIILTTFNEDALMLRGLKAGAKGFLLKDTGRATLLRTIRAAARGESLLKPEILSQLLNYTSTAADPTPPQQIAPTPHPLTKLTNREQEVLQRVALGDRNKEIAHRLGISERTIKAHLSSIYNKLGVDSRAAAIAVAARRGMLSSGPL